jgi:hypothetical protein
MMQSVKVAEVKFLLELGVLHVYVWGRMREAELVFER